MTKNFPLTDHLHDLMSKDRLTSCELSRRLKLPSATIQKIRAGKNNNPTLYTLAAIANYFGITISELIGEEKSKHINTLKPNGTTEESIRSVPIINFIDALSWPRIANIKTLNDKRDYTITECKVSKDSYAITIDSDGYSMFEKGGIIVVDPLLKYEHGHYVLTHKIGQSTPNIKMILEEDGGYYFKSIISNLDSLTQLDDSYKILGVIALYKKTAYLIGQ
ncbi:MAG: XRE family transcriptional regulator [Bacteroidia bacterium]|nr:MAG: XRE family transcriptional regulator [Bacteroidia bacterium]